MPEPVQGVTGSMDHTLGTDVVDDVLAAFDMPLTQLAGFMDHGVGLCNATTDVAETSRRITALALFKALERRRPATTTTHRPCFSTSVHRPCSSKPSNVPRSSPILAGEQDDKAARDGDATSPTEIFVRRLDRPSKVSTLPPSDQSTRSFVRARGVTLPHASDDRLAAPVSVHTALDGLAVPRPACIRPIAAVLQNEDDCWPMPATVRSASAPPEDVHMHSCFRRTCQTLDTTLERQIHEKAFQEALAQLRFVPMLDDAPSPPPAPVLRSRVDRFTR